MSKTSGHRNKSGSKSRRESVLRKVPKEAFSLSIMLRRPEFLRTCFVIFFFLVTVSSLATWSREQIKIRDGQIASTTRITRIDYSIEDVASTEARREEARNSSPRIYTINATFIERLEASLIGLPTAVFGKNSIEEVNVELAKQFSITPETLLSIQQMSRDGEATPSWRRYVARIITELQRRTPLLSNEEFQVFTTTPASKRALSEGNNKYLIPYQAEGVALPAEQGNSADHRLSEIVSRAGFPESLVPLIAQRLISDYQPSIQLDTEDTTARANNSANNVKAVIKEHARGEIIWKRGDVINTTQYEQALEEHERFLATGSLSERWLPRIGSIGLLAMLSIFIGAYTTITYPRIAKNTLRLVALCALMATMLGLSAVITLEAPTFIYAAAVIPTLFAVTVACLAYKQRMGMFIAFMQCTFITMALSQSIGWFILLIAGCGTMIGQLQEVRQRQTLIRASGVTAITFGIGAFFLGLAEVPDLSIALKQIVTNSVVAAGSALIVGFFVLGILQNIEQLFNITTGMTLADYRDPRNPLLRQLQQLAPGTFNHSRQVADIAEAATEAIGGDSLLAYVGGLYHDIGKMNKPEYFVENQTGYNRHKDLKPSMSLLVIIGHVKDGIELAREYDLPRELIHFIEAHHGTTLVEYFYHAAMKEAAENGEPINEMQFRYPGPKPHTKESAILMISDAVESASRVLPDPNPARIEALVRDLSRKRLLDHQFDDCGLTFRELAKVEDAIIIRLNSIYHTRIKYPDDETLGADDREVIEAEKESDIAG